ncbi:hypothetical protein ppKF707_1366 [Metapseudomonas furukawaii]|uniref:Uncharacterized protein n=1 Tax=Metapseudomonas furukawaii TaxID=1149133 RepID=A0AAD1BYM2_METFU|nr:hypothetical protein ppKF707_1366 [Pseudomonas furukawaii]BAU74269.1 hypothetical protein KF707C_25810 [Pseudomonas furukawaii]
MKCFHGTAPPIGFMNGRSLRARVRSDESNTLKMTITGSD